ncbi:MAG: mechanosensitive ion channel [Dehalococcoidia bacterium]|nr:mechanosensitive ion channel [Dehalococcoidia bacterium]
MNQRRKPLIGTTVLSIIVLLFFIGMLLIPLFQPSLGQYLTLAAIGLALALQKYVASFAGHFVLRLSRLFKVGDRIRIGNVKGDVRHIGLLHFVLDEVGEGEKSGGELTGRVVHVPNHIVLEQPVLNFSQDFSVGGRFVSCEYVFDEARIPLPEGMSVKAACDLLGRILREEDAQYIDEAKIVFGRDIPNFLPEVEQSPRVMVFADTGHTWLVGRFVAPVRGRNVLRSVVTQRFLEAAERQTVVPPVSSQL